MSHITSLTVTHDITLITFDHVPASISFLDRIFSLLAKKGINLDMISQTAPMGAFVSLSFTADGNHMTQVFEAINEIQTSYATVKPIVSSSNVKIVLFGEHFPQYAGVAADAFRVLAKAGVDIQLITTSDMDISILVSEADYHNAFDALQQLVNQETA